MQSILTVIAEGGKEVPMGFFFAGSLEMLRAEREGTHEEK